MDVGGGGLAKVVSNALLIGGGVLTLTTVAALIATVIAVRRIRPTATFGVLALRLQVITQTGARREVARLRLQLHRAVDGGRALIVTGSAGAGLSGEAPAPE